jgi:ketosteroid isomerase-like protein
VSRRIEILERLNVAFNERADGWLDDYADDVEFVMPPEWPDDRVLHGPAEVERVAGLWSENLDDYGWDQERLIEADDCVVGLFRHRGRIRGTDQRVDAEVGALFYFDADDKIARVVSYGTWAEALAAAGVET